MPPLHHWLICAALCLLAGPALASGPVTYDFNALASGPLSVSTSPSDPLNQDGWYLDSATAVSVMAITTGTGVNPSKMMVSGPGTNVQGRAFRNFGAPFYSGMETNAVFQLDYQVGGNWSGGYFLVGGGGLTPLTSALNGGSYSAFGPKVMLSTSTTGTMLTLSLYPKASGGVFGTAVSQALTFSTGTLAIGDWIQVQLVMDFTANGGGGAGSLFYRNLTRGQTGFTALSSVAAVNLGLNFNPANYHAANWNQIMTQITSTGGSNPVGIDNFLVGTPLVAGPGAENFEGQLATRTFAVYDNSGASPVKRVLTFPNFVPLLGNASAQGLQFNENYLPALTDTSIFARIETDPVNPANKCLYLHNFLAPGAHSARTELHYSTPYVNASQPNGTKYTFALRFYVTEAPPSGDTILQGYSEFPWLRIHNDSGILSLNLARSSSSDPNTATFDLITNTVLCPCKIGSWNTVVMQVTHSNVDTGVDAGRVEVFINGSKLTTFIGRTTYLVGSTLIPWLKAGPYSNMETSAWYDDIYWQPGYVYPFTEAGLENNAVYEFEPQCAPGSSLNVLNDQSSSGSSGVIAADNKGRPYQRWTAQLQGDGSFELIPNNAPTRRLTVTGTGASGSYVQILDDNNQTNQRWTSQWQSDGSFELIPQHNTALRLNVAGGAAADGTLVQVLTDSNSAAQHWILRASYLPLPNVPTGLSVGLTSPTSVPLTWTASIFAAGYLIERRSEGVNFEPIATIPAGDTLNFTDTTATAGCAYQYRISASNAKGSSADSPAVSTATPDGISPVLRPGFLTVTPGVGASMVLDWTDHSANETGFQIQRRATNGDWAVLAVTSPNVTGFSDNTALAGVIYDYRLRATGTTGNSPWTIHTALLHSSAATIAGPIYSADSVAFTQPDAPVDTGYVPAGFYYHLPPVSFVTGQTLSSLRNDLSGWGGMKITVGAAPLMIYELGRWVVSGNTAAHAVKIVTADTNLDIAGASVSVATAGAQAGFKYGTLASPVTLAANTAYYILSSETNLGDQWCNQDTTLTYNSSVATLNNAVYSFGGSSFINQSTVYGSFGPVDFRYAYATPFATGHRMTALRNDTTGWFGMAIAVGDSDLFADQLGRWVAPGSTGTHLVKLVNATTGANLASVTVATLGAPTGQFKYAPLATAVHLAAHASYYVLSQETAGGDPWYDFNTAAAGTASGYQSWLLVNGLPMDASGSGGATATPANDNLPNLVKFALGLTPATSGHAGRLSNGKTTVADSDYLTFTYVRPEPAPADINYAIEASSDLSTPSWSTSGLTEIGNTVNHGLRTITIRDKVSLTATHKRFMRLRILQP